MWSRFEPPVPVLHVIGSLERGGVETWLLNTLPALDASQWRFDFCTVGPHSGRYATLARSLGSRVWRCPVREPDHAWNFPSRLYRLLRRECYAIVHSHVHHFSAAVLAVAKGAGAPVRIAHSHNTADGFADSFHRRFYRAGAGALLRGVATLGLACSENAAAALFGPAWGSTGVVEVVHYGLNGSLSRATEADPALRRRTREALGIDREAPVVGHVGRFERQKNHGFLLEIAAALGEFCSRAQWLLIGDGPERKQIELEAARLGVAGRVRFCGMREDVADLMRSVIDVFVLPSLHEGLPLALLEAQGAGLRSVVSTRIGREAAVVPEAVDFLPLEAGPHAWARRIVALLQAGRFPSLHAQRQLEAAGFTIGRSLECLLTVYRRALEQVAP